MNTQEKIEKSVIQATEMTDKLNSLVNLELTNEEVSAIAEMNNKLVVIMADIHVLSMTEAPAENEADELSTLCDRLHTIVMAI